MNDKLKEGGCNPEPTDVQRAQWRKHHKAGTTPGNPKWYRASNPTPKAPFTIRPAPVYPALKPATYFKNPKWDYKNEARKAKDNIRNYVAAFNEHMHFTEVDK